jgi:hypothetical protein
LIFPVKFAPYAIALLAGGKNGRGAGMKQSIVRNVVANSGKTLSLIELIGPRY